MKWTNIPAGELNAAQQRIWEALGNDASRVCERFKNDPIFLALVTGEIKSAVQSVTTYLHPAWLDARQIMEGNFFGVEEAIEHFFVYPTREELKELERIPFTRETLSACQNTHVLVAVFQLSINEIHRRLLAHSGKNVFSGFQGWETCDFARTTEKVSWQLIRRNPAQNSAGKSWLHQMTMVSANEYVPSARVFAYALAGQQLNQGSSFPCSIFPFAGFRTSTAIQNGHIVIKSNDGCGVTIGYDADDTEMGDLALAVARLQDA